MQVPVERLLLAIRYRWWDTTHSSVVDGTCALFECARDLPVQLEAVPGGWIVRSDDEQLLREFADRLAASGAGPCDGERAGTGQVLVTPDRGPLGDTVWLEWGHTPDGVGTVYLIECESVAPVAQRFWRTVHGEFKDRGWSWERLNPDCVWLEIDVGGSLRVAMTLGFDNERQIAWLAGGLPIHVPPHAAVVAATYLTRANWRLRVGSFDLDIDEGDVVFRVGVPVGQGTLCRHAVASLIDAACWSIAEYGPGLTAVLHGDDPVDTIRAIENGSADG